jgi:catechol 2,3-dioxygenase-like lactoylglutathione lyase family enzyme
MLGAKRSAKIGNDLPLTMPASWNKGQLSATMINSIIHHLGIGLRDPNAGEPFFDRLFVDFFGLQKEVTQEAVAGWKGRGARFYIYPIASDESRGTLQHLAFAARSRAEVDQFVRWARTQDVPITAGPKAYPEYGGDYYAVFFSGPERLRLELVHLTEQDGADPL